MFDDNRNRKRQVKAWLLQKEFEILEKKAKLSGVTKSQYLRDMIIYGNVKDSIHNFSKADSERLVFEISKIGNNINQIAYRVNAKATVNEDDFIDLKNEYQYLFFLFDEIVRK